MQNVPTSVKNTPTMISVSMNQIKVITCRLGCVVDIANTIQPQNGPKGLNLLIGHILATGLPTMFSLGSVPKTLESTETALQSPRTYTSSSSN